MESDFGSAQNNYKVSHNFFSIFLNIYRFMVILNNWFKKFGFDFSEKNNRSGHMENWTF